MIVRFCIVALAIALLGAARPSPTSTCCPVIELRQYTLNPGKRDDLVRLFEDRFIESQEAAGITAIGQFRVVDDPNKFYWMRGFGSMADRVSDLTAFYHGATWKKYRHLAIPLLLETNNVLLLRPAHAGSGFAAPSSVRPPVGSTAEPRGLVVTTIYFLGKNRGTAFDKVFEATIRPVVREAGAKILATLVTDPSRNNYPVLPIRTDANVFVWVACYSSEAAYEHYVTTLGADPGWWKVSGSFALAQMYVPPEVDLLRPTPRSALRC